MQEMFAPATDHMRVAHVRQECINDIIDIATITMMS